MAAAACPNGVQAATVGVVLVASIFPLQQTIPDVEPILHALSGVGIEGGHGGKWPAGLIRCPLGFLWRNIGRPSRALLGCGYH